MTKKMTKNAIIYCRQSSGKEEDSESIAFQEENCRAYANSHNMHIVGIFSDANTPGRLYPTGAEALLDYDTPLQQWLRHHTTDKRFRAGLGEAIKKFADVDYLLVYDLSRLYRPVQDSFLQSYINQKLTGAGVTLVSIKEGQINFSNFTDSLVSSIQSQVNDNQINLTREKSKKALEKLQDSGYYSTMPKMYGIKYLGGKEREVEVIPEQAEVIRFVYDNVLKRVKYTSMLRELNSRYVDRVSGKCFYDSSWRHMIKNPFYCGYMYDSHGALIPAKQMQGKEIVTYEEWKRANEILNELRKDSTSRTHAIHPFSGLMYCGNCGSKMSVTLDGGRICYACLQGVNVRHEAKCSTSRINITLIRKSDEFTGLREAILPVLLLGMYKELERQSGAGKFQRLIQEKEILLANYTKKLNSLVDEFVEGNCTHAAYQAAYEKLNERITKLKNEILELTKEMEASGNLEKRAREYLKWVPRVMKNELEEHEFTDLLHRSVEKIICYEDHLDIHTVYGNFKMRRYIKGRFRNLPRFTYDVVSITKKKKITNLNDCRIDVTYVYDNEEKRRLVVDLSVMQIYEK